MKIYFAAGSILAKPDDSRALLLKSEGVERILISYADVMGDANIYIDFPEVMLDSGAYTAGTTGKVINVSSYALWLQIYLDKYPQIKHYITLDDMADPVKSKRNYQYMKAQGLSPIPVYHYGEPTDTLDEICMQSEYVALGGLAVGTIATNKLKLFWDWVYERFPNNKFHVLGATMVRTYASHQPCSIDSSAWILKSIYGQLLGYKNGIPAAMGEMQTNNGIKIFFTTDEVTRNNVRALLDWEKCEWVERVRQKYEVPQGRLL